MSEPTAKKIRLMDPRCPIEDYLAGLNVQFDLQRINYNLKDPRITHSDYLKKLNMQRPKRLKVPVFEEFGPNHVLILNPEPNEYRLLHDLNDHEYIEYLQEYKKTFLGGR